jgi:hypothetical protein
MILFVLEYEVAENPFFKTVGTAMPLSYLGMLIAIRDFFFIVALSFLTRVRTSILTHGNALILDFLSTIRP